MPQNESYSDLMREVSTLLDTDLQAGLDLLETAGAEFPDQLGHRYLFRASLTNRLGRPAEAIAILREARAVGVRFPARVLKGSKGLASLAGTSDFEGLINEFDRDYKSALADGSSRRDVFRPSGSPPKAGWPLIVALHGNNSTPERERLEWLAAVDLGWLLVMLASRQPAWTPGVLIWDDRALAHQDVTTAIESARREWQIDPDRIVIAGFSAGGLRAIEVALDKGSTACGLLTVAAFLTDELIDSLPSPIERTGLSAHLVIGEHDTSLSGHHVLAERLSSAGTKTVLDIRPALGHAYPQDMRETLHTALDAFREPR